MSGEVRASVERHGHVAVASFRQPRVFNAFDEATITEMMKIVRALGREPAVRAVVLTGEGKAFCAGGNLRAVVEMNPDRPGEGFYQVAAIFHQCVQEIRTMNKAVVAAINGPAAGGGFSLALACDLRVMAESAFLQQAYTSNGLCIDGAGTFTLPRLVGMAKALEIAILDERIDADTALRLGLVHRIAPDAAVLDEAVALAERASRMPVGAIGRTKRLLNQSFNASLEEQMERARIGLADAANGPEGREGLAAFLEKRPAKYL
ncbi:MAG: enoyl-CoA hydratase/isomerase family protein [Deltaproteobacteria bacterium]|nr:enoyl-CoA hydratase/isomerase family protein [Deltaproteobacteria bacterium]